MVSDKCLTQCGSKIKCIHKIFYMYWLGNMNQNKLPIILQPLSFNFYIFQFYFFSVQSMYFRADQKTAVRTLIDRKARQHIPSELMIFKTLLYIVDLFKAFWTHFMVPYIQLVQLLYNIYEICTYVSVLPLTILIHIFT